jgi:hypothetical protein
LDEDGHQNWMKWDQHWMKMGIQIGRRWVSKLDEDEQQNWMK